MECNNCTSLFNMIKMLNDNMACVLSGYELLVNIVNNHEIDISQIKSNQTKQTLSINNLVCEKSSYECENLLQSVQVPIAANVDVFSISNVNSDDSEMFLNKPNIDETSPQSSTPNVDVLSIPNVNSDDSEMFLNKPNIDEISPQSSTPKPSHVTHTDIVVNTVLGDFSDISEISSECSSSDQSTISDNSTTSLTSEISGNLVSYCNPNYLPYEIYDSQVFNLFEVSKLEDSTTFNHFFSNRSAAYYGKHSYSYGSTIHQSRDFSENPYLLKILNYVEIVYPTLKFNSAMIHRYTSGDQFIPYHSDNEEDIDENSLIATISLGATRIFGFKEIGESEWSEELRLHHGDSLIMSKKSQKYFTHGIPKDNTSGKRLSITLRLIKPKQCSVEQREIGTQTMGCNTLSIQTMSLENQHDVSPENGHQPMAGQGEQVQRHIAKPIMKSPESVSHQSDTCTEDGYQPTPKEQAQTFNDVTSVASIGLRNRSGTTPLANKDIDTLYISSSMFRHLDPYKLSSQKQNAEVLFYPGADASKMLHRLIQDPRLYSINKGNVKKIFVMIGTNNVDAIFNGSCSFSQAEEDINALLYKLWILFENAQLNIINLLPRQNPSKNSIVQRINGFFEKLCNVHGLIFVNTEITESYCFSDSNGVRKHSLFTGGYDNVHLNNRGYVILARYLKYLAHV